MSRLRLVWLSAFTLALALAVAQPGRSAETQPTCVIYSLSDLGDDPGLARWVAETIPDVIEPGSWNRPGDPGQGPALRYFPPKKIIVVYHTPAVQAKVDGFLKDLKKSLCQGEKVAAGGTTAESKRGVAPAEFREPAVSRAADPAPEPGVSYPVPAPVRPPKHLFHFIIRYEGEGIIDENVVKWWKMQYGTKDEKEPPTSCATAPRACPATGWATVPGKETKKAVDEEQDPGTEAAPSLEKAKKEDKQ
jgi:hypothetical protein